MGFNVKYLFEDLFLILSSEKKDSKKVKEILATLIAAKKYAEECGQL